MQNPLYNIDISLSSTSLPLTTTTMPKMTYSIISDTQQIVRSPIATTMLPSSSSAAPPLQIPDLGLLIGAPVAVRVLAIVIVVIVIIVGLIV